MSAARDVETPLTTGVAIADGVVFPATHVDVSSGLVESLSFMPSALIFDLVQPV